MTFLTGSGGESVGRTSHENDTGNGKHEAGGEVHPAASPTRSRKADHIRINVEEDVNAKGLTNGFENFHFVHSALPEIALDDVDTATSLFGYQVAMPVLISCMTGGVPRAGQINRVLAEVASHHGIAMGLGSGRALLEHPETLDTFAVRQYALNVPLLANLGAVQLNKGATVDDCRRLVDMLQADALVFHLNPLQEALQPEGDTDFRGIIAKIGEVCRRLDVPVVAKEIGWGISRDLVRALFDCGVQAVDVAGAGGTSWSEVERHRMDSKVDQAVAAAFADWGIPTAQAIQDARTAVPDGILFASGGVRSGIDVAKAIALGADFVGLAGPFLRAAAEGEEQCHDAVAQIGKTLRISMFAIGARDLPALRSTTRLVSATSPPLRSTIERVHLRTTNAMEFVDITETLREVVSRSRIRNGIIQVWSNHTTAAVCVNENEPLLIDDFRAAFEVLAPVQPANGEYAHNDMTRRVGVGPNEPRNSHAHIRQLLLASCQTVVLHEGAMQLGEWQRVFLVELDSPRDRLVTVQVVGT
jgi:isopentenyl-diphosphate delta-isomerase